MFFYLVGVWVEVAAWEVEEEKKQATPVHPESWAGGLE